MKAGSREPKQPEQPEQPEQKQPVAACLTLRDWVCCWSAMNSSLPPGCNAWKVIAQIAMIDKVAHNRKLGKRLAQTTQLGEKTLGEINTW